MGELSYMLDSPREEFWTRTLNNRSLSTPVLKLFRVNSFMLKGLWHGQNKWLHLFVDSEAYHEQIGPIPSSNESLDIALSNAHTSSPQWPTLFRPSTHQNWPRDKNLTQGCWCLRGFLGLRADGWKIFVQVRTRFVVTQVYIEKMFNKNIEIGFQSAAFHLCQRALVPLLRNDRGPNATASI